MRYAVQIKPDPRRHVQDPVQFPWLTRDELPTRRAADAMAREVRAEGETVRVVQVGR